MKIGKINRQSIAISGFASVLNRYEAMPSELYIAGKLPNERIPAVAIVGSRKPTPYGKELAYRFAYDLAKRGIVIISGLAYGIDAIAHKAALDAGGITIAIVPQGLHRIYPRGHTALAEQIVKQGGAVISEMPPGSESPHRHHFLARNRLISALADAVLVPEAMQKSGTSSTVGHAFDQSKEVFAIPGPVTSLLSVGPNRLLQTGAHVAIEPNDILNVIAPHLAAGQSTLPLGDTPQETAIIKLLQTGVTNGDELQQTLGMPAHEFLQALTMLEINGVIRPVGGNYWHLR